MVAANQPQSNSTPPPKRPRKAINCQPCRASKLKCDRSRPCSSCILRGTSAQCYPDGPPELDPSPSTSSSSAALDPQAEIQRIRHSLSLLESHILQESQAETYEASAHNKKRAPVSDLPIYVSRTNSNPDGQYTDDKSAPASLAAQTDAGFYAGPTSSVMHLIPLQDSSPSFPRGQMAGMVPHFSEPVPLVNDQEDEQLLSLLPEYHIIDQVVVFYVDHCCTMNVFILRSVLLSHWDSFKNGKLRTRLTLSLIFCIIAVAIQFLPPHDDLIQHLGKEQGGSIAQLSDWYYEQSCQALLLHEEESAMPSLDLIDLYLVRIFYCSISKNQAEELWRIRGCVISNAVAMGLHRDPRKWNMAHEIAERRRWAWFNVLRVDRWIAFMLGRPITFSNKHFDTVFPSSIDPFQADVNPKDHLSYIHMFRLIILFGDIMDDIVSVKPVPYENIIAHDKAIEHWLKTFPEDLRFTLNSVGEAFSESNATRRVHGVQYLCLMLGGRHTQIAMHRPYTSNSSVHKHANADQSLRVALKAANEIIQLTTACRPTYLNTPSLTVPGHIHWGILHLFAAISFLAFQGSTLQRDSVTCPDRTTLQVISQPDQSGVASCRTMIARGLIDMEALRGLPAADKAITIIHALKPLYEAENTDTDALLVKRRKEQILSIASRLPFPFLDSPGQQQSHRSHRTVHSISPTSNPHSPASAIPNSLVAGRDCTVTPHQSDSVMSVGVNGDPTNRPSPLVTEIPNQNVYDRQGPILPTQTHNNGGESFWSAAVGIETGDWARFMHDVLPRQGPSGLHASR